MAKKIEWLGPDEVRWTNLDNKYPATLWAVDDKGQPIGGASCLPGGYLTGTEVIGLGNTSSLDEE